ncbi:hypothetical protein PROFUN_00809 [Planoprotostelium fungivorum]|uniref:Uncharacterized protein n=1 Tax=Planoprotostelium fungivorum TaxID=1890364 RepID=A0A2P6NZZ0_9EUKA|nr:hypothetical protein PROFUN_00809 [Planoprotostelium fungivorum]
MHVWASDRNSAQALDDLSLRNCFTTRPQDSLMGITQRDEISRVSLGVARQLSLSTVQPPHLTVQASVEEWLAFDSFSAQQQQRQTSTMSRSLLLCVIFFSAVVAQSNPLDVLYVPIGPSANPQPVSVAQVDRGFALVDEMVQRWTVLDQACSPNAPFAFLYLNITNASIVAIQNGYFDDGNRLIDFILIFARRYLNAYDQYYVQGVSPSAPWKEAFRYADSGRSSVLENLLQGINAHINFDLGIIVYNLTYISPTDAIDYNRVNDILFNVAAPSNTEAGYRYDPTGTLTNPLTVATTPLAVDAIVAQRVGSYTNGLGLIAAPNQVARNGQLKVLETLTSVGAVTFETNRFGLLGSTSAARTAYCQTHHL